MNAADNLQERLERLKVISAENSDLVDAYLWDRHRIGLRMNPEKYKKLMERLLE